MFPFQYYCCEGKNPDRLPLCVELHLELQSWGWQTWTRTPTPFSTQNQPNKSVRGKKCRSMKVCLPLFFEFPSLFIGAFMWFLRQVITFLASESSLQYAAAVNILPREHSRSYAWPDITLFGPKGFLLRFDILLSYPTAGRHIFRLIWVWSCHTFIALLVLCPYPRFSLYSSYKYL